MAKQLNVSLGFTADTSQAKAQLQDLQNQLSKLALTNGTGPKLGFTKEIQEATTAAAQLQVQLKNATNVNTGTLDLGKFAESMNKSGMSLTKYQQQLRNLGPEGDKAFAQLAQSITNAEIPLKRASSLTTELWTTLKNTARWQLSSSMLHGFMGTLQSAYGYAKDLNESLNNIRIVTGQSVEEMDRFALKANKAAQALSTTTTAYTDAALIFYQQGLGDKEVEERTEATIKMAHAAGESAEEVSSYMTAIWNNFAKGGKSLEYYGDVMAALGAKTAASSAEIAEGLEKFASIGETVGLSYEYATAAVATIVDKTRQSADTVGTALKTIFARLQGLQLGETLEDGVDLNKYSKALQAVGVSVLDLNGELRQADDIIYDLGMTWDTLTNAQQTALAQTVAGTRQYTQLMSLMENFDDFQGNVSDAHTAEGTLDEQADIYAQSWEASRDRVTAAAEAIYGALINDDFFIDLNNFFADFLGVIEGTIDSLGGLKGVLLAIGTIVTQVFKKQIAESLGNMAYNIKMSTESGRQSLIDMKREANAKLVAENFDQDTTSSRAAGLAYEAQGSAQMEYINNADRMSQEEQQISQHLLDRVRLMGELVTKSGEELEKAEEVSAELQRQLDLRNKLSKEQGKEGAQKGRNTGNVRAADTAMFKHAKDIDFGEKDAKKAEKSVQGLKDVVNSLSKGYEDCGIKLDQAMGDEASTAFTKLQQALNSSEFDIEEVKSAWDAWTVVAGKSEGEFDEFFKNLKNDTDLTEQELEQLKSAFLGVGQSEGQLAAQSGKLSAMGEGVRKFFKDAKGEAMSMSTALTQTASTIMSLGMTINAITGLIDTWKDSEASLEDKLMSTMMTMGTLIPTIVSVVKGFQGAGNAVTIFGDKTSLAMWQVTLIVAAIAVLIGIFVALGKAAYANSPEGAFKNAKKAAEDAAEAARAVKEEYDNVKSSLDDLKSGIDAIEDLERGTIEWRKAINDSNASLIDLLSTYDMLNADNFYTDVDGLMHLKEGVEETILDMAEQNANKAQNAEYAAKVNANNAESNLRATQTAGEGISVLRSTGDGYYYDAAGANSQLSGDIGMAIANAINNGTLTDLSDTDSLTNALGDVAGLMDSEIASVADQIASNADLQAQMYELSSTVAANTEANRILNNQIVESQFSDQIDNSGLDDEGQEQLTNMMGADLEKRTEELYNQTYKDKGWLGGGMTDEDVQKQYAEAMGWATDTIDNQSGNQAKYYAKDGTEIGVISDEVARRYLAQQAAIKEMGGNVQNYVDTLTNLITEGNNIAEGAGQALGTFAGGKGGDFGSLNQADFDAMKTAFENGEIDLSKWEELGYESEEAYRKALEGAFANYETKVGQLTDGLSETVANSFNNTDLSQLTLDAKEKVADSLQQAYDQIGSEGMTELSTVFANAGEDAGELSEILAGVDWSSPTALKDLNAQLEAQGINVSALGPEWDAYTAKMLAAQDTVYGLISGLDELRGKIASVSEITGDLETGSIISDEDYETLLSYNSEIASMFAMTADGWQFVGDVDELSRRLQTATTDVTKFKEEFQAAQNAGSDLMENYGSAWKDEDGGVTVGKGLESDSDRAALMSNLASNSDYSAMVETSGYSVDRLLEASNTLQTCTDKTSAEYQEALAIMNSFYGSAQTFMDDYVNGKFTETNAEELWVSSYCNSLNELDGALASATISADTYNKMMDSVTRKEAEAFDLDYDDIIDQAKQLAKAYKLDEAAARKLAIQNQRMNKGVSNLVNNWDDWKKTLKSTDKTSIDYIDTVQEVTATIADLVGASEDLKLPDDFLDSEENLALIEKAAQGDEQAINQLGAAVGAATVEMMTLQENITRTLADGTSIEIDTSSFESSKEIVLAGIAELQNQIANGALAVGDSVDCMGSDWVNALNEMAMATGMSVEDMNSLLNQLGVETEVTSTPVTQMTKVPVYQTKTNVIEPGDPETGDGRVVETTTVQNGTKDMEETIEVAQINVGDDVGSVPKITYTGNGGVSSSAKAGNYGGGGGKGGGGGGGAKEAKKESKKSVKDETERYHVIENQLENLTSQYDAISKAKDRAFGKNKLALMDQEIAKQKEIIAKQKEYLSQAEKNLGKDAGALSKYGANIQDGVVTNYDDLVASQVAKYNDAVAKYNSLSADAQEALDNEWSNKKDENGEYYNSYLDYYEREYQNFTEALSQYEETQDLVRDKQQEIIDAQNELYDLQLEKIDYKVNLQIEFSDDELEHLEYLLERIETKAFAAAEAVANIGLQTQSVMNKTGAYKEGVEGILGNHGLSKEDVDAWLKGDKAASDKVAGLNLTESEVEKLREYTAGLRANNEALIELRQSVHDKMLETFDEWNEKIDRNINKLDHLKNMTESYRNIVDLVGKNNFAGGAETIAKLNESAVHQAGNYAQANIANRDRIAAQLQTTRDAYAKQKDTISEEERKMWEDTIKEMEDQLDEAEEAAMSSIEAWMEAINQQFIDSIEATMDKFENMVAGKFKNMTELQEAFERKQSENDRYLEDYEKIYEFSKLNRDIEKSIDNTDNIKAKKELAELQKEINDLEESGAEVSEYQIENLRKRYELKLAELALEEAQNAKSEVRMTRDNEGNWGYVYTADETQVAEAEQSYEDKLYELQQQNAEYINTLQENIIQMQIEMAEKMAEIANDESLSIEERQAKMAEVQAYYQEQMGYYASELELVLNNNKILYEDDWTKYSEATGYKISKDEEYVDSFGETEYAILTGFTSMEEAQGAFNSASEQMLSENNEAFDAWQQQMEQGPLAAMESSFDTLASDIDGHLETIEQESDTTTQEIKDDCEESVEAYNGVLEAVIAWENQYSQSVEAMISYSDNLIDKFNQVLALWADVKAAAESEVPEPPSDSGGGDGGSGGGDGGSGGGGGKPSWDRVVAAYNKINGGKWGNGIQSRISKGKADGFTEDEVRAGQQLINYTYPPNLNGMGYSREKAKGLMGYDTGGYTGAWGDNSGRLALLHQKELVLNQEDTANMLSAIDMIRQISSMIDLNAMSSMKGLGGILSAGGVGGNPGTFEQHVEIHASFPDATDHSEIEEAFNNLLNSASQYANRKL